MKLGAETLKANGAIKIYAFCSHGVLSGDAIEKIESSPLEKLFITNSIQISDNIKNCKKIGIIDISALLGEAIIRTHKGESISVLFE